MKKIIHTEKSNKHIRELLKKYGKPQYWLARQIGINEGTLTRWLRYELSEEESKKIIEIIETAMKEESK